MNISADLKHHEEIAQKHDLVELLRDVQEFFSHYPGWKQNFSIRDFSDKLQKALQSAHERGIRHAVDKMRETGKVISYE